MKARRQRCSARISDGSRPCARWAINGSTVCATHGGRAPQVKKSARERLAELVEPALKGLHKALKSNDLSTIVRASQIVLDRCGFHPSQVESGSLNDSTPIPLEMLSLHTKYLIAFEISGGKISAQLADGIMGEIEGAQLGIRPDYKLVS